MKPNAPAAALVFAVTLALGCGGAASEVSTPLEVPAPTAATAPEPAAQAEPAGTVEDAAFFSQALGVDKRYVIYLPAGYARGEQRYPVLYMLHGLGGKEGNWVKLGLVTAADALGLEAIVVMPDGDDSFYVNATTAADYDTCLADRRRFGAAPDMKTYCVKTPRYEDYITRDLVSHIDTTYRTQTDRAHRAIGGLSMGGFGALMLAMRHPDLFSAAASHAGVASLLYDGPPVWKPGAAKIASAVPGWVFTGAPMGNLFIEVFGKEVGFWQAHDPTTLAEKLEPGALALYLDCGTKDEFRLDLGVQLLDEILERRGIAREFHLIGGGRHDAAFWTDRIDDSLAFIGRHFAR